MPKNRLDFALVALNQILPFSHRRSASARSQISCFVAGGVIFAEIISVKHEHSNDFLFSAESSFQFGLLAHEAGFIEAPHFHREIKREINDLQQMFVVQRGVVAVQLYSDDKKLLKEVVLKAGDGIVLIHGIHAIKVLEDMQCISVKQGPFLGTEKDKIFV